MFLLNFNQDILNEEYFWVPIVTLLAYIFKTPCQEKCQKNLPEKVITINQIISRANCRNQVIWKILAKVLHMSAKSEKMMCLLSLCPVPQEY